MALNSSKTRKAPNGGGEKEMHLGVRSWTARQLTEESIEAMTRYLSMPSRETRRLDEYRDIEDMPSSK